MVCDRHVSCDVRDMPDAPPLSDRFLSAREGACGYPNLIFDAVIKPANPESINIIEVANPPTAQKEFDILALLNAERQACGDGARLHFEFPKSSLWGGGHYAFIAHVGDERVPLTVLEVVAVVSSKSARPLAT